MTDSIGNVWVYCSECDDTLSIVVPEDEATPLECSECGNLVDEVFGDERRPTYNEDV